MAAPSAQQEMTPIGVPSRSSGTPSMVRIAADSASLRYRCIPGPPGHQGCGRSCPRAAFGRPRSPVPARCGCVLHVFTCTRRRSRSSRQAISSSPFWRADGAMSASHSRAADSTSVSSTVCRSKVERLMTLSTSAVAVCCCSDSGSSRCAAAPPRTAARSRSQSPPGRRRSSPARFVLP